MPRATAPRWRGAAPIQRAIEAGDAESGVCLMEMEAGLDTGPVLLREATAIGADETSGELYERLADIAADVLARGLDMLAAGSPKFPFDGFALRSTKNRPGRIV